MEPKVNNLRIAARPRSAHAGNFRSAPNGTPRWRRPTSHSKVSCQAPACPEHDMQPKTTHRRRDKVRRSLRIVLLSDMHELHREVDVPEGDILLCAGDWTMQSRSLRSIADFNQWLGELPHQHKICVPGNHETYLQTTPTNRSLLTNAILLINEGVEIEGLRIWGSPVTPVGPAFGVISAEERRRLYGTIPEDTDILITHGPPRGILDHAPGSHFLSGDQELLDAVTRLKPRCHTFGHVHLPQNSPRIFETEHTTFINAALLGPYGAIDKQPIVLRMEQRR
jgi:Icc-related predicted phosphoesterase